MSHEPKSPSLGMISTATRTTATVSPLTPSPISATVLANGNTASQSAHSGFAAALRKLAKQAEEPRGPNSISGESSPVSSPATNHSSPVGTPKRGPLVTGQGLGAPSAAHGVSSTPPIVTIAPTKTVNGMWRSDGRQAEAALRGSARERLPSDPPPPPPLTQEKSVSSLPPHIMGAPYPFGLNPSAVMQDPRLQALNLSRQMPHILQSGAVPVGAVPLGAVPEEYLRSGFRPYGSAEDLRLTSLQLGLDPGYFRSGYLAYPALSSYRMDESLCLSALRSPYYQLPAGGAVPSLHPSTAHLHLQGVRYPAELSHQSLTALQRPGALLLQRQAEEERWLAHQRKLRADTADRQGSMSECSHHSKEPESHEPHTDSQRPHSRHQDLNNRELPHHLGAPPPLISPKPTPPNPPTTLWNPVSLINSPSHTRRAYDPSFAPSRPPPGLTKPECPDRSLPPRTPRLLEPSTSLTEQEKSSQSMLNKQRLYFPLTATHGELKRTKRAGSPIRGFSQCSTREPALVYDHALQQHRTLLSKLDLEEKRRREARDNGYYYELDDSYDESDEEEVRAHLKRVTEQPPLKLDQSKEKLDFLAKFGLTTLSQRDQLLDRKRKKRRKMMREHSPSPVPAQSKRQTPPITPPTLSTRYTPEEMNRAPELENKKHFLNMFDLNHVSQEQRIEKEKVVNLLDAIKKKAVTLDTLRYATYTPCSSPLSTPCDPTTPSTPCQSTGEPQPMSRSPTPPGPPRHLYSVGQPDLHRSSQPSDLSTSNRSQPLLQPSALGTSRSPLTSTGPHSPLTSTGPHSPLTSTGPHSPLTSTDPHIPLTSTDPHIPLTSTDPHIPLTSTGPHIPPSTGPDPPLPSTGPHSPLTSTDPRSPLTSTDPRSPLTSKDPHNPLTSTDTHSPPTSTDPHIPPTSTDPHIPLTPRDHHIPLTSTDPHREVPPIRRAPSLQNSSRPSLPQLKEPPHRVNGLNDYSRSHPWESLSAEEFAQHFHQSVLQSTHKSQHKAKAGGVPRGPEANHEPNNPVRYNPPEQQGALNKIPHSHTNGHSFHPAAHHESGLSDERSAEEDSTDEEEEEEEGEEEEVEYSPKWKGIDAILEAYQEYIDERDVESEVLQSECRRMEAQHYHLSVTADQLSVSMGELLAQRQRLALDRERMQAELEHIRKCLALPALLLHRAHYKGPPPR
ncbi:Genetic suppressor element 1 [Bagarius yarrelli]|uniref:Genetic suppressor element 1 n=1 Tax=Bagarius yarrelli TaxID=175774 RepID=A0A556U401_BAGYA|nr:Genetic suppressor element 1 [Bagarius yarrelli]